MNPTEQALRDQIAYQLGRCCFAVRGDEEFRLTDYIDPIVAAAKQLKSEELLHSLHPPNRAIE